jgi:hypothetical protein
MPVPVTVCRHCALAEILSSTVLAGLVGTHRRRGNAAERNGYSDCWHRPTELAVHVPTVRYSVECSAVQHRVQLAARRKAPK